MIDIEQFEIRSEQQRIVDIVHIEGDGGLGSETGIYLADGAKDADSLFDPGLSDPVKAIIDSALGTAPFHSEEPQYATFAGSLRNTFDLDASDFSFLAQSYDAAYVAAYALGFTQVPSPRRDGKRVAEGISRLSDGQRIRVGATDWPSAVAMLTSGSPGASIDAAGAGGSLDFDENGDAPGPYEIWQPDTIARAFATCNVCESGASCDVSTSACNP